MANLRLAMLFGAGLLVSPHAVAKCPIVADPGALLAAIADGGYVIVFRHADKYASQGQPRRPADLGRSLPINCLNQDEPEVLNDHGVAQAQAIGAAFESISVDGVFATRACRTIETAEIAFGRSALLQGSLGDKLSSSPASGKNTIIVSHSSTIRSAMIALDPGGERILSCGEAAVFDPDGDAGRPKCIALVLPNEWSGPPFTEPAWVNEDECDKRE